MGRRISKEFLHPSILESVNDKIGNLDSLETDAKGNMVQAINELVEKLDNSAELEVLEGEIAEGKELIANAVGEPLTAEESFDEMSTDINGLLSTFKTNMMNNGVTVESGDKFKALIDKIATLADNGGKGIQFAEGTFTANTYNFSDNNDSETINYSPGFIPNYIFVKFTELKEGYDNGSIENALVSNLSTATFPSGVYSFSLSLSDITENSFKINCDSYYGAYDMSGGSWYAIGVGEEDTTLRDSLASILENKGVDVTEEDDMASLITKVDSISGGLDIISATELPESGRENQICVITDNPVDEYMIYQFEDDMSADYTGIGIMLSNVQSTTNVTINSNPGFKMHILSIKQNNKSLDSYIYTNGTWNPLTISKYILLANGVRYYEDKFGYFDGSKSNSCTWVSNKGYFVDCSLMGSYACAQNNKLIDFSKYSKITITLADKSSSVTSVFEGDNAYLACLASDGSTIKEINFYKNGTYTLDISDVNKSGYIGIGDSAILANAGLTRFLITYICIE